MSDSVALQSDADTVIAICSGDEQRFTQLFHAYWASLCRFAAFSVGDDEAREIVAKVFATLWERRAAWTVTTTVQAYLYGAVRNELWHRHRDAKRRSELLEQHFGDTDGDSKNVSSPAIDWKLTLQQLITNLPERYQMALHLRYSRDLDYPEIGEVLAISPEAAKKLVTRAVGHLRKRISSD